MNFILNKLRSFFSYSENLIQLELFFAPIFCVFFAYYVEHFSQLVFDWKISLVVTLVFLFAFIISLLNKKAKQNIRFISNYVYLTGMSMIVYICYKNSFNIEAFYLLMVCFGLYCFMQSSTKIFVRFVGTILALIFFSLCLLKFKIEMSLSFIFITLFVISIAGFFITASRDYYRKKIKSSEKKYRDLIDKSIFGILIFSDEKIAFANNRAINLLEYKSLDSIIGVHRDTIINVEDIKALKKRAKKIIQGKNVPLKEFELITAKKNKLYVESKPTLIDFDGKQCVLSSFVDITDRKQAEIAEKKVKIAISEKDSLSIQLEQNRQIQRRLQNSQSYSEGIIESSLDMIFTTDIKGKITKLNTAAQTQLQLSKEDFHKKTFDIILEDKTLSNSILSDLNINNSFSGKVRLLRKDGSSFPAFLSISHLYTIKGTFLGIMGVSRDISDIISKEQEIKEQASKLTSIIESSSHYFFSVNKNYRITSYNRLFIDDIKDKLDLDIELMDDFFDLVDKERKEELSEYWKEKFKHVFNGGSINFEIERKTPRGEKFFREIFLNPIYSEDGSIEEVSGIGHDVTQKKLNEIELKKSLDEKEILLKEVHHRVKNNLQVISSILNLQSSFVKDQSILFVLKESQNRIRSMASIHERLYRTDNFSDIKFSAYVRDLAKSIFDTYELSNVSIELVFSLDEVFLTLNTAIPCGLIINELISNSLKYAFAGRTSGQISIDLHKKEELIILSIADNGVGISESIDIESSETLGLQLVSTLVEQIEGKIEINTKNGTAFLIKFNPNLE